MKRILLTSTALVMAAGAATAETSVTWSGAASVGVARTGSVTAVATQITAAMVGDLTLDYDAAMDNMSAYAAVVHASATTTAALLRAEIIQQTSSINNDTTGTQTGKAAAISALEAITAILDAGDSTAVAVAATSDFETYSEVNATVTGNVSMDNGMSLSAAVSVDAGKGYNFADDEGFDASTAGSVSLDAITFNAGAMGTFTIDENSVDHLVDADDDSTADLGYTNTFGSATFSAAIDVSTDDDTAAVKAVAAVVTDSSASGASAAGTAISTAAVDAIAADVQWSAKVSMPVAGGTAYVAMDEEGGNVFGASTTVGGFGVSFSSSLEAAQEEWSVDRSNTVGLTYVMGSVTAGASWNSVEDGDQWGISAAYAGADGMSISASTDEGSDWAVSGAYKMGSGASVVGGVNYTEDAYLGLSFAF